MKGLLYFYYYAKVKSKYLDRKVWLVENNTNEYSKANEQMRNFQKEKGILKALYLPNLLDLNMVKEMWDYQKN